MLVFIIQRKEFTRFSGKNQTSTFLESTMSVVVQKMIKADFSAVMMTLDPLSNENLLAMEATYWCL
jgi:phosphoenolpyruvate synthase/pyruvate phosphate dikinase